jgi:hypothetical protein
MTVRHRRVLRATAPASLIDLPNDLNAITRISEPAIFGRIRASFRRAGFASRRDLNLEFMIAQFTMPDFGSHSAISYLQRFGLSAHP